MGTFAGLIYACIMLVDCLFFMVLEWVIPRESLDYVSEDWDARRVELVRGRPAEVLRKPYGLTSFCAMHKSLDHMLLPSSIQRNETVSDIALSTYHHVAAA